MHLKEFSVVSPTFRCRELAILFIKSFEKFKPDGLNIHYVIVENSDDETYKEELQKLKNVTFVQNKDAPDGVSKPETGSTANAQGIEIGLSYVTTEYVFIAHCDTAVVSEKFFSEIDKKIGEGNELVGTLKCVNRIRAYHILGLMVKTQIAKSVSMHPTYSNGLMRWDVGDSLTDFCRKNNISRYCFKNTSWDQELHEELPEPFKFFNVATCIDDDGEPIFLHLSRGIPKSFGTYRKPDRVYLKDWVSFMDKELGITLS